MKPFVFFALLCLPLSAFAESPDHGIGLTLGSPSGLTARSWLNEENSIDAGLGWGVIDSNKFELYGDYLWNREDAFQINTLNFDFFYGGGASLRSHSGQASNEVVFGPRIPLGVSHSFSNPDLEVFAVFALNVGIIPHSDVYVDLHLGARFYLF